MKKISGSSPNNNPQNSGNEAIYASRSREYSKIAGLNMDQLRRLSVAILKDVEANLYDGGVIVVARHGIIGLHEAIGFANRATDRSLRIDDVFKYGREGGYKYGEVKTKNFSGQFIRMVSTNGQTICKAGDSGGPCFRGNTAIGIVHGASTADDLIFCAVSFLPNDLGVTVLTVP